MQYFYIIDPRDGMVSDHAILRINDDDSHSTIPLLAEDNPDKTEYEAWLAAGNTPSMPATAAAQRQAIDIAQARAKVSAALERLDITLADLATALGMVISDA
jgi:hypothetical protein